MFSTIKKYGMQVLVVALCMAVIFWLLNNVSFLAPAKSYYKVN